MITSLIFVCDLFKTLNSQNYIIVFENKLRHLCKQYFGESEIQSNYAVNTRFRVYIYIYIHSLYFDFRNPVADSAVGAISWIFNVFILEISYLSLLFLFKL